MRISALMISTAILLAGAGQAAAFSYKTCLGDNLRFSSSSVTLRYSTTSFPSGYWRTGILDTIGKFNSNPSNFRYSALSDSGGVGLGNGQSEVWGSSSQGVLQGAPAIAYQYWTCYWLFGNQVHMDEVDVVYDFTNTAANPFEWTADTVKTSLTRYTGSGRALQTTGAHELGHGAPLNHVNTEYNIMGADFEHIHVNGNTATAYVGEDASDGLVFLYGAKSSAFEDLGVVHWRYLGPSGEYSDHEKTKVFNTSNVALPTVSVNGETGYRVTKGNQVRIELTYENNGKTTRTSAVRFYVSTNDTITTLDTFLGSTSLTLGRGDVYTIRNTVTIPSNLVSGQNYWVGAVIDPTGALAESSEANNATYIPIRIN